MKFSEFIVGLFTAIVAGLVPLYAFFYLVYLVVGLPLRRQERARMFLDLVETGLAQGRSIEDTVVSVARSRDTSIGVRFHLLAAYLESGWTLPSALQKAAGLLPPQMIAMIKVGQEIGQPQRILPACRTLLNDATSHIQSAYNYLVVLAFVLLPFIPALLWMMTVFVLPKFQMIFADMTEGAPLPNYSFHWAAVLSQVQIVLSLGFYLGAIVYLGGPRLLSWIGAGLLLTRLDGFLYRIPWRRKRIQRDFAAMLGVLLDAGVKEDRAVTLAAESTANQAFIRRADRVVAALGQGTKLPEALGFIDPTGEFHWRLTNALRSGKNFFAALAGWLESLDADAFRQQQTFAQLVTTGLVLYNGVMVGLFAIFVFGGFTRMIEEGVLW
jgi:type II secretory pathway component PulF